MLNYKNETVLIKLVTLVKINGPNLELLLNNMRVASEDPKRKGQGAIEPMRSRLCVKGQWSLHFSHGSSQWDAGKRKYNDLKKKKKRFDK